ncbi:TorF family putative porin [Undibacterium sp. TJN25]|uniref:TorF family putative porin n=1 Tax=Undibacterium sp. TJN25 TaxID=3413056 RepID=UPI003BF33673
MSLLLSAAGMLASEYAWSQVSGSVSLVSDYRFRGVSLSDGQPEPQASLGYDSTAGWYAGVFGSGVKLREGRDQQLIAYAGYSQRQASGLTWEVGATNSSFMQTSGSNYAEAFAGLSFDEYSGRLYISPNYFGQSTTTAYLELNASHLVAERTSLLAHVGYLRWFSGSQSPAFVPVSRMDTLIGVSTSWSDWRVQLAWVATARNRARSSIYDHNANTLMLSGSYSF